MKQLIAKFKNIFGISKDTVEEEIKHKPKEIKIAKKKLKTKKKKAKKQGNIN
jgi:hypothetical protein|tara:strand:+ start:999 stop:1154 length:156 start_codon:yes stop_codon:yes gene_type:complete